MLLGYSPCSRSLLRTISRKNQSRNYISAKYLPVIKQLDEREDLRALSNVLKRTLNDSDGYEWYPFKIGSYNVLVPKEVQLNFAEDAFGVVVLSTPTYFEKTLKSWLQKLFLEGKGIEDLMKRVKRNPLIEHFKENFGLVSKLVSPVKTWWTCDFEPVIHRPPQVSLPLAGHAAGAAYFYRPYSDGVKRMGLALHPQYCGHFSFRGVIVFPDTFLPERFSSMSPVNSLKSNAKIVEAIDLINYHYKDNRYRDVCNPIQRYSDLQLQYFNTIPRRRWRLIAHWFDKLQT